MDQDFFDRQYQSIEIKRNRSTNISEYARKISYSYSHFYFPCLDVTSQVHGFSATVGCKQREDKKKLSSSNKVCGSEYFQKRT